MPKTTHLITHTIIFSNILPCMDSTTKCKFISHQRFIARSFLSPMTVKLYLKDFMMAFTYLMHKIILNVGCYLHSHRVCFSLMVPPVAKKYCLTMITTIPTTAIHQKAILQRITLTPSPNPHCHHHYRILGESLSPNKVD
jgi:hypothetical protein